MKRIRVAWLIVFITFLLCGIAVFFVKSMIVDLNDNLKVIERSIKLNDVSEALNKVSIFEKEWNDKEIFLSMFMDHIKIESVDQAVNSLRINLEQQRLKDALIEVGKTSKFFDHISDTETPSLSNIL
ncbi:MAG: DUF4363 family protein [Oscillospiraceae bacterium]|jgi:hypothetical protein|nr:DUF4363 family protein [Oscillospiraceae bacterium]